MLELKIIQHADINQHVLDEIISIKSVAWPYTLKKQLEWINNNLKNTDIHVLLLDSNRPVAYLNLIQIDLIIDNTTYNAFGVGNVCAIEKGKGYGTELLKRTNYFILKEKKIGLLFCKPGLAEYYKKCDWIIIEKPQIYLSFNNENIESMIFNYNIRFHQLTFFEQAF